MCAMPSIRLNNELRDTFKRKVIEEILPRNKMNNPQNDTTLGQKLLDECYTQAHKDLVKQLPLMYRNSMLRLKTTVSGFYVKKPNVTTLCRNNTNTFNWDIESQEIPECFTNIYYYSSGDEKDHIMLPYDHWATTKLIAYEKERGIWNEQRTMLEHKLDSLLISVNSSRQLFNAWPDAIKYKHHLPIPEQPIARAQKAKRKAAVSAEDLDLTVKLATAKYKQNI